MAIIIGHRRDGKGWSVVATDASGSPSEIAKYSDQDYSELLVCEARSVGSGLTHYVPVAQPRWQLSEPSKRCC